MLKKQLKFLVSIVLVLGLSISLQSLIAAWQEPTVNPPGGNINEPINTGFMYQKKNGDLDILGDFGVAVSSTVLGNSIVGGNLITSGNMGVGITSPTQKLDVNGKIRMRSQTQSTDGQDVVATKKYVDDNIGGGGTISLINCHWSPQRYYGSDLTTCIGYYGNGYVQVGFDAIKDHGYIRYNRIYCCKIVIN